MAHRPPDGWTAAEKSHTMQPSLPPLLFVFLLPHSTHPLSPSIHHFPTKDMTMICNSVVMFGRVLWTVEISAICYIHPRLIAKLPYVVDVG